MSSVEQNTNTDSSFRRPRADRAVVEVARGLGVEYQIGDSDESIVLPATPAMAEGVVIDSDGNLVFDA